LPLGPVIGPLVICGFLVEESRIKDLQKLGVRDSKTLSPQQREYLAKKLREIAKDMIVLKISASHIDKMRTETNLNKIETKHMQDIINTFNPDKVFLDAFEANTKKLKASIISGLKEKVKERIDKKELEIICENYADSKYVVVSAASIVAKVTRDAEIEKLKKIHGDFGSGYPSDPKTINFLKNWLKTNKSWPDFVRHSWMTAKDLKKAAEQKVLGDF
jgi:ribonuclease HII